MSKPIANQAEEESTPYLFVSLEQERVDQAKPYDTKMASWIPDEKEGFLLGEAINADSELVSDAISPYKRYSNYYKLYSNHYKMYSHNYKRFSNYKRYPDYSMKMYHGKGCNDMPAHIFAVSDGVYWTTIEPIKCFVDLYLWIQMCVQNSFIVEINKIDRMQYMKHKYFLWFLCFWCVELIIIQ